MSRITYNTPKCVMTELVHSGDTTLFPVNRKNIRALAQEVFKSNPHYKLKFENEDRFLKDITENICGAARKLTYSDAERIAACTMEDVNSRRWTFHQGITFCPYWEMDETEYWMYSEIKYRQVYNELHPNAHE